MLTDVSDDPKEDLETPQDFKLFQAPALKQENDEYFWKDVDVQGVTVFLGLSLYQRTSEQTGFSLPRLTGALMSSQMATPELPTNGIGSACLSAP